MSPRVVENFSRLPLFDTSEMIFVKILSPYSTVFCLRTNWSILTCSRESWQNYCRRNGKHLLDIGNSMLLYNALVV